MATTSVKNIETSPPSGPNKDLWRSIKEYKGLLLLLLPGLAYFIIFHYVPMYGLTLAFKDFALLKGIRNSPWAGFVHFHALFRSDYVWRVVKNTLVISISKLVFGFPAPIIFALLLNEVRNIHFKKTVQTVSYLPNFISWVVMAGIFFEIFSFRGPVNEILGFFGVKPILFFGNKDIFVPLLVVTEIIKGFGWGSIIYFAAISSINPELYESAVIDGANRFRQAVHITLPCLVPVITILLTLSVGGILSAGFDQIINMYNPMVMSVADILDTYIYRVGIREQSFSFTTAVGLLKSLVAVVLIVTSNLMARALGNPHTLW
jgi:putative aldouronate transport system permease protein